MPTPNAPTFCRRAEFREAALLINEKATAKARTNMIFNLCIGFRYGTLHTVRWQSYNGNDKSHIFVTLRSISPYTQTTLTSRASTMFQHLFETMFLNTDCLLRPLLTALCAFGSTSDLECASASDARGKTFAVMVADTVAVTDDVCEVLAKMRVSPRD